MGRGKLFLYTLFCLIFVMSKLYKYATIAVAISLIVPALAVGVTAQQMGTAVSGDYTNSDWETQITFPQGWTGMSASIDDPKEEFSVSVSNAAAGPGVTIMLEGWYKKLGKPESVPDWLHRHTPTELNCVINANNPTTDNPYGVTTNLNGMNAIVVIQECGLPGAPGLKSKSYGIETAEKAVVLSLIGSSGLPTAQYFWPSKIPASQANNYDKYLEDFETSAKTFKVSWAPAPNELSQNPTSTESVVVPEFPMPVALATAAVIGLVVILGRTKLVGTNGLKGP